jgi:hypothetical protein
MQQKMQTTKKTTTTAKNTPAMKPALFESSAGDDNAFSGGVGALVDSSSILMERQIKKTLQFPFIQSESSLQPCPSSSLAWHVAPKNPSHRPLWQSSPLEQGQSISHKPSKLTQAWVSGSHTTNSMAVTTTSVVLLSRMQSKSTWQDWQMEAIGRTLSANAIRQVATATNDKHGFMILQDLQI